MRSLYVLILVLPGLAAQSQEGTPWRIDGGLTFSHFQQQVKAVVGDPRGERLVNETQFGIMALGSYNVWDHLSLGVFMQFDRGNRHAARFNGFDPSTGRTVTSDKIGGNFLEFWSGPFLRLQWKSLFGEFGYGLIGFRNDDARTDLPSTTGDTTATLALSPSVAWFVGLGVGVPLTDALDLSIRMEYRLRYYDRRGGNPFVNKVEHGTQNITPFVGISWKL